MICSFYLKMQCLHLNLLFNFFSHNVSIQKSFYLKHTLNQNKNKKIIAEPKSHVCSRFTERIDSN
jgi:hypothetical protein